MVKVDNNIRLTIIRFIKKIAESNIKIQKAYLYGSFAKGTNKEWSDIDVALISSDFSEDRLEERIKLSLIASDIDNRIEAVPYTPQSFNVNDPLAWEIQKTGVIIEF